VTQRRGLSRGPGSPLRALVPACLSGTIPSEPAGIGAQHPGPASGPPQADRAAHLTLVSVVVVNILNVLELSLMTECAVTPCAPLQNKASVRRLAAYRQSVSNVKGVLPKRKRRGLSGYRTQGNSPDHWETRVGFVTRRRAIAIWCLGNTPLTFDTLPDSKACRVSVFDSNRPCQEAGGAWGHPLTPHPSPDLVLQSATVCL